MTEHLYCACGKGKETVRFNFKWGWVWPVLLLPCYGPSAHATDGGLDSYGCHHDRTEGNYHCHWGTFAGKKFSSKNEMLRQPHSEAQPGARGAPLRTVTQVVSGDTLILENNEKVQLIGVDAPDAGRGNKPDEHYGRAAAVFTKWMVQGKRVRVEFDEANANIGHKDRYQRTLAYVFLEDGTFLNAEVIRQGHGFANTRTPFKYLEKFNRYQQEARSQGRGLWAMFSDSLPPDQPGQGVEGKVATDAVSSQFVMGIYRTRRPTFVHNQPRKYSRKIFKLEEGTTVNVVGIHGEWLMIKSKHGKMPGFIRKEALIP